MDRRDFFKYCGLSGLSLLTPRFFNSARAATNEYQGPLWIMIHASGGWDPTSLIDPKGRADENVSKPVNMYFSGDIQQSGNIRYAPFANYKNFFDKYAAQLLVLNGIDVGTNDHSIGTMHTWSGSNSDGFPALAALLAGVYGPEKPLAFIVNGGYDTTAGLVAPSRLNNFGLFQRIAYPALANPTNKMDFYLPQFTQDQMAKALQERQAAQLNSEPLLGRREAMAQLFLARSGQNELKGLVDNLPANLNDNNPILRQTKIALAAYKAGVAICVNVDLGGFDTHGNHDATHVPRMQQLLEGIDLTMQEAERQNLADQVIVVVGSDFGRTPNYNAQNGKDHWSITSMMLMGKGIRGQRVVGMTDANVKPVLMNPTTFAPDPQGIKLTPQIIHRALRKLAGVDRNQLVASYPLMGMDLANLL